MKYIGVSHRSRTCISRASTEHIAILPETHKVAEMGVEPILDAYETPEPTEALPRNISTGDRNRTCSYMVKSQVCGPYTTPVFRYSTQDLNLDSSAYKTGALTSYASRVYMAENVGFEPTHPKGWLLFSKQAHYLALSTLRYH